MARSDPLQQRTYTFAQTNLWRLKISLEARRRTIHSDKPTIRHLKAIRSLEAHSRYVDKGLFSTYAVCCDLLDSYCVGFGSKKLSAERKSESISTRIRLMFSGVNCRLE